MRRFIKRLLIGALMRRRWPRSRALEEGYAILLPTPMDMPFMLRFALEGLRHINTENCRQILVVPDAWGTDGGEALRCVASEFDDPRIAMAPLRPIDYRLVRIMRYFAVPHWLAFVNGTAQTRCAYAFLHDADAFFIEREGLERHYRECRDRGMFTLGVSARTDEGFLRVGCSRIAATWELMYSVAWALGHGPLAFMPGKWTTPHGLWTFDSMLRPQYLDYASGKIGVMESPPAFVHFYGVIGAYRAYQQRRRKPTGRPIVDQRLRLLLLALFEDLIPATTGRRALPTVEELERGLTDPSAPVTYATVEAAHSYPFFHEQIELLYQTPTFRGPRADQLRERLRPFDEYFQKRAAEAGPLGLSEGPKPHYVVHGVA
jgi:hypothetical protein